MPTPAASRPAQYRDGVDAADLRFELDDLSHPAVAALLEQHLAEMHATSPPESVHALPVAALRAPEVALWSAWAGQELLGVGALKLLDGALADAVEVKSMRTTAAARGRGVGTALLRHLLDQARAAGRRRVLLETGAEDYFAAARRLYARHGFRERPPFGHYRPDPLSVYMELVLEPR